MGHGEVQGRKVCPSVKVQPAYLANILKTYAAGDESRNLRRTAAPIGQALVVSEGLSFLKALTNDDNNNNDGTEVGEAFVIGSDSESSAETQATGDGVASQEGAQQQINVLPFPINIMFALVLSFSGGNEEVESQQRTQRQRRPPMMQRTRPQLGQEPRSKDRPRPQRKD